MGKFDVILILYHTHLKKDTYGQNRLYAQLFKDIIQFVGFPEIPR